MPVKIHLPSRPKVPRQCLLVPNRRSFVSKMLVLILFSHLSKGWGVGLGKVSDVSIFENPKLKVTILLGVILSLSCFVFFDLLGGICFSLTFARWWIFFFDLFGCSFTIGRLGLNWGSFCFVSVFWQRADMGLVVNPLLGFSFLYLVEWGRGVLLRRGHMGYAADAVAGLIFWELRKK